MKGVVFSFVLGLGVVASGCGVFDVYRDRQRPRSSPARRSAPAPSSAARSSPPAAERGLAPFPNGASPLFDQSFYLE
jgi:hypothetical protein